MSDFTFQRSFPCACGRTHSTSVEDVIIEKGAVRRLPEVIARCKAKRVFLLSDPNTDAVAGGTVRALLRNAGMEPVSYVFREPPKPSEFFVGSAMEHFDFNSEAIVVIGSGVLTDIGKMLSAMSKLPCVIVATAPSCDAFASATSSMERDGLKVSLNTGAPNVIIGDTDILKTAPDVMLQAGLGDMIAKYVSLVEWRLSNIITGEYYCPAIAELMKNAVQKCVDASEALMRREDDAVASVFEGLVLGGLAMAYAGVSRPASGIEHYFSHVWDMRSLQFGTPSALHGIQCGIGTLLTARLYDSIRDLMPDREKALRYVAAFDYDAWKEKLRAFIGEGAEAMIENEAREHKYDKAAHAARLERIIGHWDEIRTLINEELPHASEIESILDCVGAPKTPEAIGIDPAAVPMTFLATKDIRDKYILSRLCFDLGILDEMRF